MPIHESAENYLETILMLSKRLDVVRSIDIAADMRFSKPSVSIAMKNLRQEGFIEVQSGGSIVLTQSGLKIAERIYERHCVIARFLMQLGVEEPVAFEDACKIAVYARSFGGPKHMSEDLVEFILNWEAESYRKSKG